MLSVMPFNFARQSSFQAQYSIVCRAVDCCYTFTLGDWSECSSYPGTARHGTRRYRLTPILVPFRQKASPIYQPYIIGLALAPISRRSSRRAAPPGQVGWKPTSTYHCLRS
jgi:hypothetical protein